MALIELRVEQDRPHLQADFDTAALARHDSGGIPPHAHPGFIEFSGGVFVSDNTPPLGLESGGTGPPDFCP